MAILLESVSATGQCNESANLADADSPPNFAVPSSEAVAAAMAEPGVGNATRAVLYDDDGSFCAARA